MLLENKNSIVYGGGGGIGGGVARAFAREGAHVFIAGRTREKLDAVARDIEGEGGSAAAAVLDALDENAVDEHADTVAAEAGGIDVSFNLISLKDIQGRPLAEMSPEDFARREAITESLVEPTMLGRTATLEDVGNVAAFVASDKASSMTAASANTSCGALVDQGR